MSSDETPSSSSAALLMSATAPSLWTTTIASSESSSLVMSGGREPRDIGECRAAASVLPTRAKMGTMAMAMGKLCEDLVAETADLEALVVPLDASGWATPTPAEGWDVKDQVGHLAYFDDRAHESMTDPDAFIAHRADVLSHPDFPDRIAAESRRFDGRDTLAWFRRARAALVDAARTTDPSRRVPWYGPDMSVASSITARIMETWAHGQDVADAFNMERKPTDR